VQSAPVSNKSFAAHHTYAAKGRYVVSVTAMVGSTVVGRASLRVVVNNG
jgi:nitrogen fixation protein FixH